MEIQWRHVAQAAYEKYAENLDCEIDAFDTLPQSEVAAWIAAVRYACELFGRACLA